MRTAWARRSLVNPNQGFWRQLCAFEAELGITQRCAQPQKTYRCLGHLGGSNILTCKLRAFSVNETDQKIQCPPKRQVCMVVTPC